MDTTLILAEPSPDYAGAKADAKLLNLISKWEFCEGDWDGTLADSLPKEYPARLFSREGSPECADDFMKWAKGANALVAVHVDGSNEEDTYDWDHKAYITWWGPRSGGMP